MFKFFPGFKKLANVRNFRFGLFEFENKLLEVNKVGIYEWYTIKGTKTRQFVHLVNAEISKPDYYIYTDTKFLTLYFDKDLNHIDHLLIDGWKLFERTIYFNSDTHYMIEDLSGNAMREKFSSWFAVVPDQLREFIKSKNTNQ